MATKHADPVAVDIGAAPLPNNAQQPSATEFYDCPGEFDPIEFEKRYGFTIQTALNRVLTALLRPNLARWDHIDDDDVRANLKNGDIAKQKLAIDWVSGRLPWDQFIGYFGSWGKYLGCVDISAIHDLGAGWM